MNRCVQTLRSERKAWRRDHPPKWSARPVRNADGSSNILKWHFEFHGPKDSAYEGAKIKVEMIFPETYPSEAPSVKILTKDMFHPNIYSSGSICLSTLKSGSAENRWKEHYGFKYILKSIRLLLMTPNPDDPTNCEAAHLYKRNRAEYNKRVKERVVDKNPI